MEISQAQRDVRSAFAGGAVGQAVSGAIWLASAALTAFVGARAGVVALVAGGALIYPLTQLLLKLAGRPGALPAGHPMQALAVQVAFVGPLMLPLVGAATLHRADWFYPAMMVAIGAHYLPFSFLYGMRLYLALAAAMVLPGIAVALYAPRWGAAAGAGTGALLLLAALAAARAWRRERSAAV
jgi:hypothetical protein